MADSKNPDLYDLVRGFQAYVTEGTDFSDTPRLLHESNTGVDPHTGRPYAVSAMTGEKHHGLSSPVEDHEINQDSGSVPVEMDQEANSDGDAYWVMVDDLITSLGRQRAHRVDGSDDEVYIMTGGAEGITVKVTRRGR
jgi:hypothetical protein